MKNTFYFTYNAPLVLDEFKCFEFFILLAQNLKVSQMIWNDLNKLPLVLRHEKWSGDESQKAKKSGHI